MGDEIQPKKLHQAIRKKVRSWWDYKRKKGEVNEPLLDVTIWEAPEGKLHAHWMLQIPLSLLKEAEAVIRSRCEKVLPILQCDTFHCRKIYNLNGLMAYLLKGTEPEYAKKIDIIPENQGPVWGRRTTSSMALGKSARERDWRLGLVVNHPRTRGLPMPREKRVMEKTSA